MVEKEEKKSAAAAAAASRKAGKKVLKAQIKYWALVGTAVVVCLFSVWLVATGAPPAKKGGESPLDKLVNDYYFIEGVNTDAGGNFTAAASPFFANWKFADLKWGMNGVFTSNMVGMAGAVANCEDEKDMEGGAIPPAYDARDAWPDCSARITNAGNCTSSYAVAAANALSSRYCIADSTKYANLELSPQQILSCDSKSRGCKGGGVDSVWAYIQRRGLYPEECLPYKGLGPKEVPCKTQCAETRKLQIIDHCVMSGVKRMKREILSNGPVVAPLEVMDSFLVYKSGVYEPQEGARPVIGANGKVIKHAVSVLGWGKADGMSYWVVQNSWGSQWGEDGFARVAIGSILNENYIVTATPSTEENLAKEAAKQQEAAKRKEAAKIEREARDQRIREKRAAAEAEQKKMQEQEDVEFDAEDDFDLDATEIPDEEAAKDEDVEM